ncbi:hypothetical protein ACVPOR_16560 [Staphylococcus aureus]
MGFEVVDCILEKNNFSLDKQKFKGAYTIERMNGDKSVIYRTNDNDEFVRRSSCTHYGLLQC